jgi:DNA-binding LytR/AlgR family response regulator
MFPIGDRMLVWVSTRQARVIEPMDVYWLEAEGRTTWVRLRGRGRLRDHRSLAEVVEALEPFGFLRIHRNHAVNLRRLGAVRRRSSGIDWEVKLEPPVNRVLPVARGREDELVAALSGMLAMAD